VTRKVWCGFRTAQKACHCSSRPPSIHATYEHWFECVQFNTHYFVSITTNKYIFVSIISHYIHNPVWSTLKKFAPYVQRNPFHCATNHLPSIKRKPALSSQVVYSPNPFTQFKIQPTPSNPTNNNAYKLNSISSNTTQQNLNARQQ
jgi:hypothetical protein